MARSVTSETQPPRSITPAWDEGDRLQALADYCVLDTPREAEFDDIVRLASETFGAPISVVNLIAEGRQWFKAEVGIGADELPLDVSICAHAILQPGIFVVPDTTQDARFACNPLVTGEPGLRFYAGALLETPEGWPLGTVCVLDTQPRPQGITDHQRLTLEVLSRQVMTQLELRRAVKLRDLDIAARQDVEERFRELNDGLETQVAVRTAERNQMWALSCDIMLRCGFDGRILTTNPAWSEVLGWGEGDLVGTTLFDLIHPDDLEHTRSGAQAHAEGRSFERFQNRYRSKGGEYRWISWSTRTGADVIIAVGRDITEEKARADALQRAEEQLRQAQKMEAVGQLTGGLAHDFNNLLAGISGSLELMQTRVGQGRIGDLDRYITAAQGAARRAAALTHRLLAFSRRQTLAPKPTDANRLVSGMEDLIRRTIGPAITLEVVGSAGLWPTLVDPSQLENALLNLCINARDAMPGGGRITVETANKWLDRWAAQQHDVPEGQYLSLCVTDTGVGMSPETIQRVFEPFFTTKPIGEGTGLGLSMIYGFAQQSGGQVRIYSELGQGTTVCIYLPRHHGESMPDEDSRPGTLLGSDQGETVLIVDDEPTVRMLVTEILSDLGYTTLEAADSPAGLKIMQSDVRIDLLVTDVGLPGGMNGRQMAEAGRAHRPDLKVLFITGYAENAVFNEGRLTPGMAVITKPFAMETMATRIREMIAAPTSARAGDHAART